jgi:radical SAM superfamily enzyme YgiQ (UPF0313 family)
MKLLLIVSNDMMQGMPSLGVAYIASYLRRYLDFDRTTIWQHIPNRPIEQIKRLSPDIIGMSASAVQFSVSNSLACQIRRDLDIPILLGGPQITSLPDYLPECYSVGVVSEGEQTTLELLQLFEQGGFDIEALRRIKGIVFHRNGHIIKTPPREPMTPLDRIPMPARDLISMDDYISEDNHVFGKYFGRGTAMFTSRGCPYDCIFCCARKAWGNIRFHSPEYVVNEMKHLIKTYNLKYIYLYDDLFVADRQRVARIADLVEQEGINEEVRFGVQGRANLMTEKVCDDLRRMGVVMVSMGMESGVDRVLRMLKTNTLTTQHVRNAVSVCKKHGFEVDGSFMIGSPTETKEEMLKTLEFIKELGLDKFAHFITTPYPGTPLWDYAVGTGQVPSDPRKVSWSMFRMTQKSALACDENDRTQFVFADTESRETILTVWRLFEHERLKLYSYRWEDRAKKLMEKSERESL